MSDQAHDRTQPRYRRVVLDLPPRAADRRVLRMAAELARFLDVELHAVFVEDPALATLADFPFARELRLPGHDWQPMTGERLADEMRHAAGKARRDLDAMRAALGVRGEMEVRRGDPASVVASICVDTDIVVVATPSGPADRMMGNHARRSTAAHRSAASVMLLPAIATDGHGPIVALVQGAADESLLVAARIAGRAGEDLVLLVPRDAMADVTRRAGELIDPATRLRVRELRGRGAINIRAALAGLDPRLLVLTRGAVTPDEDRTIGTVADASLVPILVLEPPPAR